MISVLASGHDCGGCHCVATIETVRFDPPALTVNCFLASIETKAIALLQAARGPCDAWKPPVPSELRPPLFERLVV
ncbi:MAG: hypothetical protein K8S94_01525 [Planctomycetia bacterium]|nr:hypothetical protein [Planctomycetia bacterium]